MTTPPINTRFGADTTDFQAGLAAMNRELRVIESGFRASASSLGDWSQTATGLESRMAALTDEIDIQQAKVAALNKEYARIAGESGEGSKAAQELLIKLNKETEALGKMQTELRQTDDALNKLGDESDNAGDEIQDLGEKTGKTSSLMEGMKKVAGGLRSALSLAAKAAAGLAAGAVGIGLGIAKLVTDTAASSAELVDLAAKTGLTTDRLQELAYIGDQVGTDVDTMTGAMARLVRSMDSAQSGQGDIADAFKQLGISVIDANGDLRDSEQVFYDALTAMGEIANETERDAIAMQIFGKSAQELNPLIKAGSKELARLAVEARNVGAVVDTETLGSMADFQDSLDSIKAGLKGTLATLAGAFLPGFQILLNQTSGYLKEFAKIVQTSDGDLTKMTEGVSGLVGRITQDIVRQAPQFLKSGLAIIQGIIKAVTDNLPTILPAAIEIIKTLIQFIVDNLPLLINAGIQIVLALVDAIIPALPTLVEAGIQAIIALIEGITEALPKIVPVISDVIPRIILILLDNLPLLVDAAAKLIIALAQGLADAIPIITPYMPQIIEAMVKALIASAPILLLAAVELIKVLAEGLVAEFRLINDTGKALIATLLQAVFDAWPDILDIGKKIVTGIWAGMIGNATWLLKQVTKFFDMIIDGAKETLGIHSPSAVFAEIGANAGQSYVDSLMGALSGAGNDLRGAFGQAAGVLNAGQTVNRNVTQNFNLTANYPAQSPASVAADIRLMQMLYGEA
jgi:hypothetical protein